MADEDKIRLLAGDEKLRGQNNMGFFFLLFEVLYRSSVGILGFIVS